MRIAAKFDGNAFVPTEPIDLPIGTEAQIEVESDALANWLRGVERRGPLPFVDLVNLDRGDIYP